ncbi:hypothetical protein GCM10007377_11050 [Galliscardovia ingluviei]|uniref:Alpha-amylase n=1 Tax=Galliscardovia ingluviei TaxID=1769422 RepID=A0A8J3EZI2_9BIFI|nr:carbohydrate binding domain-containing protein [Galliscardovia ingluviei]GGI14461.1 hypothetical protein GCM10007377_11050 [Galliscardovia ingluviei]
MAGQHSEPTNARHAKRSSTMQISQRCVSAMKQSRMSRNNSNTSSKPKLLTRIAAGLLSVATLAGGAVLGAQTASAATTERDSYADTVGNATFEQARQKYGLTQSMKNGAILHAWMWSFKTITNHMEEIAKAGYTSIQTEPMSHIKTNPANGKKFAENWYYVYQPASSSIGNFVVGTEDDLKEMTATAHKYGIRIIVDVVANHFTSDWNAIDPSWQDKNLFHARTNCPGPNGEQINYGNRWQVTQCHLLGLWDINTQNQDAANRMQDFLVRAVNDGVDGFRFDAAKHVELPDELGSHSVYWDTILQNGAQYQYGEVLQGDGGLNYKGYADIFTKYSHDGGGNTASDYGKTVRAAIRSSNLSAGQISNISNGGAKDDQLVTWVESHDNYANSDKESTYLNDYQLKMGWALVGSRKAGAPLYFNRPVGSGGSNPQFAEQSQLGDAGDDMWKDPSVVAVNHFRNAMDGKSEYLRNCGSNSCLMVERYAKDGKANDGVVIANMGGDANLSGTQTTLDDGTYKDEVGGGTITVSGGTITQGSVKGGAVSVFYNADQASQPVAQSYAYAEGAASFTGDTTTVTFRAKDVTGATYSTSEGASGSFKDGDTITVGAKSKIGDTITVTVKATNSTDGSAISNTIKLAKQAVPEQKLAQQYKTNTVGFGKKKTITIDKSVSDWDSSMIIAQGAANDDPRVYRPNSMYEVPIDLYTLYGAYDDNNAYLMWEMTNVQDVVAPNDNYPLTQGTLFQNMNVPFFVAFNTGDSSTRVGKNAGLSTGGTIWDTGITWQQPVNKLVAISTNGANGPWVYGGDAKGLNANAMYGPAANAKTNTKASGIKFGYGQGILSQQVKGIDGGYGENNGRVIGDVSNDSARWVDFNTKGHNSSTMDFHYEMAIPLSELGITAADIESKGLGVELVATMGKSGMDALPYDMAMNDNAALDDAAGSQEKNSFEKSDFDNLTTTMAYIGKQGSAGGDNTGSETGGDTGETPGGNTTVAVESVAISGNGVAAGKATLDLSQGASALQLNATVKPDNATNANVAWKSSDEAVATVSATGLVTPLKAGTATITATADGKSANVTITVTGEVQKVADTTVYYPNTVFGADSTFIHYSKDGKTWTTAPGEKMTAACDGWVKATIKDMNEGELTFVFTNGSRRWDNNSRKNYKASGSTIVVNGGAISADAPCSIPVESVSIIGEGIASGKLTMKSGASTQLSAIVNPTNATKNTVTWSSSAPQVVNVTSNGTISATSQGSATITATADGKSASITVTVQSSKATPMTVWYKPSASWTNVKLYYRIYSDPQIARHGITMEKACDGWYSYTISDTKGAKVNVAFFNGIQWDTNKGKNYFVTGDTITIQNSSITTQAPNCSVDPVNPSADGEKQTVVWYKPNASWKTVKVYYRVYSTVEVARHNIAMTKGCDGWYKIVIDNPEQAKVNVAFTNGTQWDTNNNKHYYVNSDVVSITQGAMIDGVVPQCSVR